MHFRSKRFYAQVDEKLFSRMVEASKDMATVRQARNTSVSTNFVLQPTVGPCDAELSNGEATETSTSRTKDRLLTLDELRKLRSEADSVADDKS